LESEGKIPKFRPEDHNSPAYVSCYCPPRTSTLSLG
jgi:hypothetical protein